MFGRRTNESAPPKRIAPAAPASTPGSNAAETKPAVQRQAAPAAAPAPRPEPVAEPSRKHSEEYYDVKTTVFNALIDTIDLTQLAKLDAAAANFSVFESDGGVGKIRPGLAVPGSELHDLNRLTRGAGKCFPKIARKPAGLQFEFRKSALLGKERALANLRRRAQLLITFGTGHRRAG